MRLPTFSVRIETPRYVLRPPSPGDARALGQAMRENAAHLRPWSPVGAFSSDASRPARVAARIQRERREWRKDARYSLYVFPREGGRRVLGGLSLFVHRGAFQNAYLGYWAHGDFQGQGLTTECVRALVGFAFGPLGLHRLQANVIPSNGASLRVLEKLGFRVEGHARHYLQIAGRWQDHVLTALTTEDWKRRPAARKDDVAPARL